MKKVKREREAERRKVRRKEEETFTGNMTDEGDSWKGRKRCSQVG